MEIDERIRYALEHTKILKWPQQLLATCGSSTVNYYVVTEPVYSEFERRAEEVVIREGKVTWGQPRIFTPSYIYKREGFSEEAKRAIDMLIGKNPDLAGILYPLEFSIVPERMNIVSGNWEEALERLVGEIERGGDVRTTIIKGTDVLWDVSLVKFIMEMTIKSAYLSQFPDWGKRGLITWDTAGYPVVVKDSSGVPIAARKEIERMFHLVREGRLKLGALKEELDRWGLFEEYEERFFGLFKEGRK